MSYKDIRHAQAQVWPAVEASMKRQDLSRLLTNQDPAGHTSSARRRARIPRDQVVVTETIWALAKADLLCNGETQKLIDAVRKWYKAVGPDMAEYPVEFDPEDFALREALNNYLLAINPAEDEELPAEELAATVSSNDKLQSSSN